MVEDRARELWIRLRGKYEEKEEIKIEATMFSESISDRKSCYDANGEDVQPHINVIVDISKGKVVVWCSLSAWHGWIIWRFGEFSCFNVMECLQDLT
uniref:Uncharacterized protein n=1 Tax=Nelumbo nucifera TaxID=4432 RepID=A0A822Z878_NELNU|nr:TPA_asm: hypothetical protein HUJ06_015585 [Nelumbo nucifera]